MRGRAVTLLALALALAGCGSSSAAPAAPNAPVRAAAPRPGPPRVAVIVLENHELSQTVGSRDMPYFTRLAHAGALATRYYGIRHPSLPNYVALLTGTTAGITSDCNPADCPVHARSLVDQLETHHLSWRAYMQGVPHPCYRAADAGTGRYAVRHDPFMYLPQVASRPARCRNVVPFSRLAGAEAHGLARFTWITPDLCNDAHDCGLEAADAFLSRTVPRLLRALGRRGLLLVTFDEGTTGEGCCGGRAVGGRIAMVAAGARARAGVRWGAPRDHVAALATVEDQLGLSRLATTRGVKALAGLLR